MAGPSAYATLKSFLQAQFSPTPVLDFDQIDAAIEQGDDSFLLLDEVSADETLIHFGDSSALGQRESGILTIECFIPGPEQSTAARTLAESVRDTCRHQRLSGVRVVEVTPPEPVRRNEGRWSSYAVAVAFNFDFTAALPAPVP